MSCMERPRGSSLAIRRISWLSPRTYSTRRYVPIATVATPFSTFVRVGMEHCARSATCSMDKLRLSLASRICSPVTAISFASCLGNLLENVAFVITLNIFANIAIFLKLYLMLTKKTDIAGGQAAVPASCLDELRACYFILPRRQRLPCPIDAKSRRSRG